MSDLIGELHRSCPDNVQVFGLHRQGTDNIDRHGSDFAVSVTKGSFKKIAFFQLKKSDGRRILLERSQFADAMNSGYPPGTFFYLAANPDPTRFDFRVGSMQQDWSQWPNNRRTPGVAQESWTKHTQNLITIKDWTRDWLRCAIGTISSDDFDRTLADVTEQYEPHSQADALRTRRPWIPRALVKIVLPNRYETNEWS